MIENAYSSYGLSGVDFDWFFWVYEKTMGVTPCSQLTANAIMCQLQANVWLCPIALQTSFAAFHSRRRTLTTKIHWTPSSEFLRTNRRQKESRWVCEPTTSWQNVHFEDSDKFYSLEGVKHLGKLWSSFWSSKGTSLGIATVFHQKCYWFSYTPS